MNNKKHEEKIIIIEPKINNIFNGHNEYETILNDINLTKDRKLNFVTPEYLSLALKLNVLILN